MTSEERAEKMVRDILAGLDESYFECFKSALDAHAAEAYRKGFEDLQNHRQISRSQAQNVRPCNEHCTDNISSSDPITTVYKCVKCGSDFTMPIETTVVEEEDE